MTPTPDLLVIGVVVIPMVMNRRANMTVTLTLEILEKLEKYKRLTGKPKSRIIEEALKEFFERHPVSN